MANLDKTETIQEIINDFFSSIDLESAEDRLLNMFILSVTHKNAEIEHNQKYAFIFTKVRDLLKELNEKATPFS